jgi:hypothetical protein
MIDRPTPESTWKGPFSYDIDSDGMHYDVAVLSNPDHSQGSWVKLVDFRDLERQRDAYAETLRLIAAANDRSNHEAAFTALIRERHPELAP